jgi:maltodextrin utilization protein YvdJ
MQKFFLISFILACLFIPVRRARRQQAFPLSRVITDYVVYMVFFGVFLRFVFGRIT